MLTAVFMAFMAIFAALQATEGQRLAQYTTYLEKTIAETDITDTASFSIPSGQCSGYVDKRLLCGVRPAGSVRVVVREAGRFSSVRIPNDLQSVSVLRQADATGRCEGEADVDVSVGCHLPLEPSRRPRRSLQYLPALPGL